VEPARARRRVAVLIGPAIVGVVFVTLEVMRANEPLALDQGLFACFGRWVRSGWLPYRDLFDSKPPLFLYTWVLGSAFPGNAATAMWHFEALWLIATMLLAARFAGRLWGAPAGWTAAAFLFVGLWAPGWGGYWARAQAEELLALPVFAAALAAVAARDRAPFALVAGVLTGMAGLYKIAGLAVAFVWPLLWLERRRFAAALARTALLLAGIAIPWLCASGWFAAHGAFAAFVDGVFRYQRHIAAVIAPPVGDVVASFAVTLARQVPWLLALAAAGIAILVARRRREAVWLTAWLLATSAAVIAQRQLAGYHFLLVIPALALAAALGCVELVRLAAATPWRPARVGALALLAIALVLAGKFALSFADYGPVAAGGPERSAALVELTRGSFSPLVDEELAAYVRARTAPNEGILVWGLAPGIYALADRHPTTRFPFHKVLLTDAPLSMRIPGLAARRAELMARLRRDPPRYIVVGRGDANGFEPEDSATSLQQFTELRDLVAADYRLETDIGRFLVYRRGASSSSKRRLPSGVRRALASNRSHLAAFEP
jgi:4-amino-4-deoxy-L-arabinose transferase-like glycosyltransferase